MPELQLFVPLAKVDATLRHVHGVLAEEALDKAKEIFDYDTSKPYFQKWNESFHALTMHLDTPSVGNVREMHTKSAAGKFIKMDYDDVNKRIDVVAEVVDDQAWKKVLKGVYTGFSIGGDYARKFDDPTVPGAKRYTAIPAEGSLVDNPCMYGATIKIIKSDGSTDLVKFVGNGEGLEKATKRVAGHDLNSSAFLIVGDKDDPKTWHLPVHFPTEEETVNHIKAAMGRVNQVGGVSHQVKSGAARRLAALASKHGIGAKKFLEATYPDSIAKYSGIDTVAEAVDTLIKAADCQDGETNCDDEDEDASTHRTQPDANVKPKGKMVQAAKKALEAILQKFSATGDGDSLNKCMYDVSRMADVMQSISYLEQSLSNEAEIEGDKSTVPAALRESLQGLTQVFLDMAEEESKELAQQLTAKKAAKFAAATLTKGGAPTMGTENTPNAGAAQPSVELKKYTDKLGKVGESVKKAATAVIELRKSQDELEDAIYALENLGKAATPEQIEAQLVVLKAASKKIGTHSDQTEAEIEEIEGEASSEVDALMAQKSRDARTLAKMQREHQRQIQDQQRGFEKVMNGFLGGLEKMFGGNQPAAAPAAPARTAVASVEKTQDGVAVGGLVKSAGTPAATAVAAAGGIPPVDNYGMPNAEYIEKSANGSNNFVEAVKKSVPQSGNPFPPEFGSASIF